MSKFILGKKIEMTQRFKEGEVVPVTLIEAGPCTICRVKTKKKDGYQAVQLGYGKKRKPKKPEVKAPFRYLREFRTKEEPKMKVGEVVDVSIFQPGEKVHVTAVSRGRGFAGVVKRWGFKGGPAAHGHKDQLRMPGSIGATDMARVWKGKKMAGRMGAERVTVKNLEIIEVNKDKNLLAVKGAVPGARNTFVEIKSVK